MPKNKERGKFKEFLIQNGYLVVFTIVCGLGLVSYFLCNSYFDQIFLSKHSSYILNASAVKGVWVNNNGIGCPNIPNLNVDRCIESSYLEEYESLDAQEIALDRNGRLLFSNDVLFVSGIFDIKEELNKEIWPDVYVGDLNIKINEKQWVLSNVIWDKGNDSAVFEILKVNDGYILVLSPSVSMVNRTKQFWVYRYINKTEILEELSFQKDDSNRSVIDSGELSFVIKDSDIYILLQRYDPALMGNSEIEIYMLKNSLEFDKKLLVLNGY